MRRRSWWAPAAFLGSFALFGVLSWLMRVPPYHPLGSVGFFDLKVYRASAGVVMSGDPLYSVRFPLHLSFTYPPFAALFLLPLRLLPIGGDEVVITVLNGVLLVLIARWTLALPRGGGGGIVEIASERRVQIAWLAAAVGVWTEPVNTAIGYGQIDILIAALVLLDLSRRSGARGRGMAIGLAAGLKLTPLIFVVYLVLCGRRRAARNATLTFAATVVAGFLILPVDARRYWSGAFLDTSRVGGRPHAGAGPADQSLRGALMRVFPQLHHPTPAWLALAVVIGCLGLALAVRAASRGDATGGFVLTAITGLLVSPISWTHQWTIAIPGLLLFVTAAASRRAKWWRAGGVGAFLAFSWAIWLVIVGHPLGLRLDVLGLITADLYVLAALGVLLVASASELARGRIARRRPSPRYL